MASRVLQVVIVGDSASAQRAFEKTGAAAMAASREAEKSATGFEKAGARMSTLGGTVAGVGKNLSTHLTAPLLLVGGAAVKMSLDFQKAMLLVETHTETSHKQVEAYKKAILEMSASGKYTQGPKELADAMYHIASDGYKGEQALQALRESANLAMLGQSELAETTYAVVSAMKTGIKGTRDLHETIGVLNGTMGAGDTKMDELTAALSTGVVTAARAAGLELKDVGAALAFMTARGVPAQKAAYGLSMNFQQIVPYTKKAKEAFESVGLGFDELGKKASSGPEGWLHALEDLKSHLAGLDKFGETQVVEEIFGGGRTSRGVLAQLQNLKDLGATYERLGVIAGRTDKNLSIARQSEANTWKEEWAKLQSAMVEMGNALTPVVIPIFKEVAGLVTGIAKDFNSLSDAEKGWVIKAGLAVAALGPMLTIGGNILKVFGAVETTVGKIGRGLGVLEAEQAVGGTASGSGVVPVSAGAKGAAETAVAEAPAARWIGAPVDLTDTATRRELGLSTAAIDAKAAGGVSEGEAVRDALGIGAGGSVGTALKGVLSKGFVTLGGLVGGYFAAEFGAHAIEGITGADLLENQSLKTSLTHGFNTEGVAPTEHRALTEAGHRERGINPGFAAGTRAELLKFEHSFHNTLVALEGDGAAGMSKIDATLEGGLQTANDIWVKDSKPWRDHTAKAMEAAVAAIEEGMHAGTIKAKAGQQQINQLLQNIHVVKGDDPFGLAKATAASFKKAGGVTEGGVKKWAAQLAQMPPAARTSTIDATDKILQAWAQGHPKIERSIEGLTKFEVTHFGATNKQLREGVKKGATGPVAEAFVEAAQGVGGALGNIGTNTNAMLKALGLHDMVQFQAVVFGPSRMGSTTLNKEGGGAVAAGEAKHHNRAGGGSVRVPGQGLHDTVPLSVNGKMSAVVAPGEDLVVFNRHQRPLIDQAVANEYGVAGLPGFFNTFDREHYKASGGSVRVNGPRSTGTIGQGVMSKAAKAVDAYFKAHEPKRSPSGGAAGTFTGKTPSGVGTFQGFPVDNWIIPELLYAQSHGWSGSITSGYRTPAHSAELGFPNDEHTKTSYPGGAVDFGGMHEAAATANRAAFIAATAGYKGPKLHVPIGFVDDGHMSGTGHQQGGAIQAFANRGVVGFAKGGIPGKPGGRTSAFGKEFQGRLQDIWAVAAPFYGHPGHSMPRTWSAGATGGRAHTAAFEDGSRASYLGKGFADEIMLQQSQGEETLIHEWAHYFQPNLNKRLRDGHSWEVEGGAEAFARWAAPQIYSAAGLKYHNPGKVGYPGRVAKVVKGKGMDWVEHGQFKAKGGSTPGFSSGGVVHTAGNVLMRNGLTPVAAASIIGNAYQESSWDPASVGSGGGGLWGFTAGSESLASLQAYAAAQGKPWTDVATQTQFLLHNLPGSTKALLNKQTSAGTGAAIFMENWEHPAEETENQSRREEGAVMALHMLGFSSGSDASTELGGKSSGAGGKHFKATYEKGKYGKGRTVAGGTSAGFAPHKEIQAALKAGAAHAKNPTMSHGIPTSKLPSWGAGLPLYQREELEGRGTTFSERGTILGNAETNAAFEGGSAERALGKAKTAYAKNPDAATWGAVAKGSTLVQEKRKAQVAASKARKLFEKGYIKHLTVGIKKVNAQLASGEGKLTMKQVAALEAKRAELVSLRASARGEAQTATESLQGYEEAGEAEAAELESESPLGQAAAAISEATFEFPELEKQFQEAQEGLEGRKAAEEEHTAALRELSEALKAQTELASSVTGRSAAVATGLLADMLSGHVGAKIGQQAGVVSNGSAGSF